MQCDATDENLALFSRGCTCAERGCTPNEAASACMPRCNLPKWKMRMCWRRVWHAHSWSNLRGTLITLKITYWHSSVFALTQILIETSYTLRTNKTPQPVLTLMDWQLMAQGTQPMGQTKTICTCQNWLYMLVHYGVLRRLHLCVACLSASVFLALRWTHTWG